MKVLAQGYLTHLYWGLKLSAQELDFVLQFHERPFSANPDGLGREFSLDTLPLEYQYMGQLISDHLHSRYFSRTTDRAS
jgi:alpha-galactosidase